jgi:hypothetical protein
MTWYYIGSKSCGCKVAITVDMVAEYGDTPDNRRSLAETFSEWAEAGYTIDRVQLERAVVGQTIKPCEHKLEQLELGV